MSEFYGIVANLIAAEKHIRAGAKCWICQDPGTAEHSLQVRVISKGGRWIYTHLAKWKLENFRAKWLPPSSEKYRSELSYPAKEKAEQHARIVDQQAREERARRNLRKIERLAGMMDECGRRKEVAIRFTIGSGSAGEPESGSMTVLKLPPFTSGVIKVS